MGQGRKLSPDEMDDNEHETDFSIPKYVHNIPGGIVEYSIGVYPLLPPSPIPPPQYASAILFDLILTFNTYLMFGLLKATFK